MAVTDRRPRTEPALDRLLLTDRMTVCEVAPPVSAHSPDSAQAIRARSLGAHAETGIQPFAASSVWTRALPHLSMP